MVLDRYFENSRNLASRFRDQHRHQRGTRRLVPVQVVSWTSRSPVTCLNVYPRLSYREMNHQLEPIRSAVQAETQAELDALLPSVLDRAFRGEL